MGWDIKAFEKGDFSSADLYYLGQLGFLASFVKFPDTISPHLFWHARAFEVGRAPSSLDRKPNRRLVL
jgi:hypothetical protein